MWHYGFLETCTNGKNLIFSYRTSLLLSVWKNHGQGQFTNIILMCLPWEGFKPPTFGSSVECADDSSTQVDSHTKLVHSDSAFRRSDFNSRSSTKTRPNRLRVEICRHATVPVITSHQQRLIEKHWSSDEKGCCAARERFGKERFWEKEDSLDVCSTHSTRMVNRFPMTGVKSKWYPKSLKGAKIGLKTQWVCVFLGVAQTNEGITMKVAETHNYRVWTDGK